MSERDQELRESAAEEIKKHKERVESDPYRLSFHHMPPVGLLNDPNGLVQWNGTYHLFYQWMPFDTGHGAKFWGHYTSEDLMKWNHEKPALTPSDWFDKNGVYSGSAIVHNDLLYLFYTGNVKDENGNRETYQCMAVSGDGVNFEKKGVVVELPEGYTAHFRDPKVWKQGEHWYMVIGAQSEDLQGKAALLRSDNLYDWKHLGDITGSGENELGSFGYMWECPDVFRLEDQDILLVSPQGLESDGMDFANTYQSGYFAGKLNYDQAEFKHGDFRELDRGFEFYAPQTTLDEKGRRILVGWMGVPDQYEQSHPTIEHQWIHCLTMPRELTWNGSQIIQSPLEEMKEMRGPVLMHSSITIENDQKAVRGIEGRPVELNIEFERLDDQFAIELFQYASISYKDEVLTLSRPHLEDKTKTEFRRVPLQQGLKQLHLFIDHSTLEIFVNGGEEVFSSRIYPQPEEERILFTSLGTSTFSVEQWKLGGYQWNDE
ncbi:sucrose-6-phosphate hydrolase [Halobacillus yeomjeoni]|uniref:Sucrose-6-phosphate hydrolase n=1 Tax=Halobacillus yeomjeoni TaxID=311194 RepID=A0A931HW11_9BACI|nr:sucrose-6-phosphate hydrolase [Halobacillus yeomjeoni]MBH0230470.1 sucrose-6-phosphate hydrolase [Halobacillus yeomjeoni]